MKFSVPTTQQLNVFIQALSTKFYIQLLSIFSQGKHLSAASVVVHKTSPQGEVVTWCTYITGALSIEPPSRLQLLKLFRKCWHR